MVAPAKRELDKEQKKVVLYTKLSMRVIVSFILLGFIGWNTVFTQNEEAVWYALLGNLTSYWLPTFENKEKEEKETNQDASN